MKRRDFIRNSFIASLSLSGISAKKGFSLTANDRPNLLLIYCDDLGYGDLGYTGHPIIKTPHIDKLASSGMILTNNYSGAPNCSPSRACLLTGRASHRTGFYDILGKGGEEMELQESEITIAELMKDAGYETFHGGKWHLTRTQGNKKDEEKDLSPMKHGFDYTTDPGMASDIAADFSSWLSKRKEPARPLFAYMAFHESHMPVEKWSPEEFRALYKNINEKEFEKIKYGGDRVDRRKAEKEKRAVYYGCVSQLDSAVGALMTALEKADIRKKIFIYFSSDNGPEHRNSYSWGTPGDFRGAKGHLHDGGVHAPGFIVWPGRIKPGSRSDQLVHAWDILPTFCNLAGVKVPADRTIDGINLLPIIDGKPLTRKTPLYWSMWGGRGYCQYAMRDKEWKILAEVEQLPKDISVIDHIKKGKFVRFELYNLKKDPDELNDLAKTSPEVLNRMKKKFMTLHNNIRDEGPDWDMENARKKSPKPFRSR